MHLTLEGAWRVCSNLWVVETHNLSLMRSGDGDFTRRDRTNAEILRKSMEDLTEFANMGHRVMLVCERQLSPEECNSYLSKVGVLHL